MTQIAARILYPEIRAIDPEGGLFVWVDPEEYSTLMIQSLIKDAPFKTENTTEYHATVLYHKGPLPVDIQMPMDFPARGRITEFVVWGGGYGGGVGGKPGPAIHSQVAYSPRPDSWAS